MKPTANELLEILAELFADQNGCELTKLEILKGDHND